MELQEFLEKFLPDYKGEYNRNGKFWEDENEWLIKHFPEALQNYTGIICEKQRENCAIVAIKHTIYDRILVEKAKQPKIDEL